MWRAARAVGIAEAARGWRLPEGPPAGNWGGWSVGTHHGGMLLQY